MFAAKNNGEHVKFGLAAETYFTDAECAVVGLICQVDKYDVEILMDNHPDGERKVWLKKSMVVSTEVLR